MSNPAREPARERDGSAESALPAVAVVIAVSERPAGIEGVFDECRAAFQNVPYETRFILVAEPWAQCYLEPFRARREQGEPVRLLIAGQSVGETALVRAGVAEARPADVVVTMPAYHRVDAVGLPLLVQQVRAGADMAVAKRWPRRDGLISRAQTKIFHWLLQWLTGTKLQDVASGVRAMRPDLLEELPVYGDLGRFLPVLAARQGYDVVEVEAEQHALDRATRIYSPGVYLRRVLDLFNLFFLSRFTEKPLRFFGLAGAAGFVIGFVVLTVLAVQRFQGQSLADRPLLLLGLLLVVLGVQAIALGLIGEIIVHVSAGRRKPYRIAELDGDGDGAEPPPDTGISR